MRFMPVATVLDHVGLVGRDLGGMLEACRSLGFAPTRPQPLLGRGVDGTPIDLGQTSAHLVFGHSYVELTSVSTNDASHHLAAYLQHSSSLAILAIGTDDVVEQHAKCVAAGLPVGPLREASRVIEYGDLRGEAGFSWFMLEPAASPEGLLCFVQHRTPALVFQRAVQQHRNGVRELSGVIVFAMEADPVARRLGAALDNVVGPDRRIPLRGGSLQVLDGDGWRERFPGAPVPASSCFAGFTVATDDLQGAQARTRDRGIEPIVRENSGFWLQVPSLPGCIVEFTS